METYNIQFYLLCLSIPPYSLGKLVEWKLIISLVIPIIPACAPYSLGKLVEWKRAGVTAELVMSKSLPTR